MMTKVINMLGVTHLTTFQKILRGLAMTIHYNLYIYMNTKYLFYQRFHVLKNSF
jgi:hypothetical protein